MPLILWHFRVLLQHMHPAPVITPITSVNDVECRCDSVVCLDSVFVSSRENSIDCNFANKFYLLEMDWDFRLRVLRYLLLWSCTWITVILDYVTGVRCFSLLQHDIKEEVRDFLVG